MKKTYQIPQLDIMFIHTEHFIAASGIDTNNNTAGLNDEEAPSGVEAGSRHRSVWDDEELLDEEF